MIRLDGLVPYYENSINEDIGDDDICVKFTDLRPGEKLYEELLIGNNQMVTEHPRIMSATEISIEKEELTTDWKVS